MHVVMVGAGYVGLVSGACFAEFGANVTCIDRDKAKIHDLKQGKIPIYEPGLENLVYKNMSAKRLSFSDNLSEVSNADAVFIAVGSHVLTSSCAHHLMNMSSCVEVSPMVVSVPKRTMKRSVPETSIPRLLVGAFETVVLVAIFVIGSASPPDVSQ